MDDVRCPLGRHLRVVTCMTTPRQHAPSDLAKAAGAHGHSLLQTSRWEVRLEDVISRSPPPLEDTEEMTQYVTTCDDGMSLERSVTQPRFSDTVYTRRNQESGRVSR